jgi:hypothetical protein
VGKSSIFAGFQARDAKDYVRRFCGWMKNNRLRIDPSLSALREGFTTDVLEPLPLIDACR